MLMVHSGAGPGAAPGHDLLRFAALTRSETPEALVAQATRQIDGLRLSIAEALARTQEAFDRGDLADVRATMESISAQAEAAASIVRALTASLPPSEAARVTVELPALLARTLDTLRPRLDGGLTPVVNVEPGLPSLQADPRRLQQALAAFMVFAAEAAAAAGGAGRLVLEVARGPASGRPHRVVEVRIRAERPEEPADAGATGEPIDLARDVDLAFASHVVGAHGGVVWARRFGPGRVAFVLELPCA
jgi:hypothetical protein